MVVSRNGDNNSNHIDFVNVSSAFDPDRFAFRFLGKCVNKLLSRQRVNHNDISKLTIASSRSLATISNLDKPKEKPDLLYEQTKHSYPRIHHA